MKRPRSSRGSSSFAGQDRGSVKRQKTYSTRIIPWEEQRSLGGDFVEAGEGNWPVRKILAERARAAKTQYQIEWEPHPTTGEEFVPVWRQYTDVADDLIRDWQRVEKQLQREYITGDDSTTAARRARSGRVVPDSSGSTLENPAPSSDAALSPPSLGSGSSVSALEISETQDHSVNAPLTVKLPPLPTDKAEYETWRNSQTSPSSLTFSSPENRLNLTSSRGQPQLGVGGRLDTSPRSKAEAAVSSSRRLPLSPSQVSESSPRVASSQSKPRSKLGRFVEAAEDIAERSPSLSSQSLRFITQLPHANDSLTSQSSVNAGIGQSLTTRSSGRLSSPFEDRQHTGLSVDNLEGTLSPSPSSVDSASQQLYNSNTQEAVRTQSSSDQGGSDLPSIGVDQSQYPTHESLSEMASPSGNAGMRGPFDGQSRSPLVNSLIIDDLPMNGSLFESGQDDALSMGEDPLSGPLTIHASIEEGPQSSAESPRLLDLKENSSQESLYSERQIETVDGIMIPVRPILGPHEFVIALPAEGKVKSAYEELIRLKKKAILRFINRRGAPGTSDISSKKTIERNEMQEMLQRLNDTVTHTDLGLPMAQTQYDISASQNAAYAEYAGSKFVLLGHILDQLKDQARSLVVLAQDGPLQMLLEQYITLKEVKVRRHGISAASSLDDASQSLVVDLFATQSDTRTLLPHKPSFVIAFDLSFSAQDQQIQSIRSQYGKRVPVVHFLVANSSEHIERCVPDFLTSNIRLKVVVRTTYLASPNLGVDITYIPDDSDQPADGRPMDSGDLQRAVRKSPGRRLSLIADILAQIVQTGDFSTNWILGGIPDLQLTDLPTPPKASRASSRTPQPRAARTQTPASRATTPLGRKRMLDADNENGSKRQRLTPVQDRIPDTQFAQSLAEQLQDAGKQMAQMTSELDRLREQLTAAQQAQVTADAKVEDWRDSHSSLLHRHEKNKAERIDLSRQNKKLNAAVTRLEERETKSREEKEKLKQQVSELKRELKAARDDLKAEGGDVAALETAREEARTATAKMQSMEQSLNSTKGDFEFTRSQYQDASKQATELASQNSTLESQVDQLKSAAEDSKRSLKAMNYQVSLSRAMDKADQFRLEVRNREAVIKKLQDENTTLKSRRGVQTRGSSVQPASSPAPRSRQGSPAGATTRHRGGGDAAHPPGDGRHLLVPPLGSRPPQVPSGSRADVLRNQG